MDALEHLAQRAKNGDDEARNDLMKALEPIMRGFFINRIGLRGDVDDLVQNSLVRVHRSLPDLKDNSRLQAFAMKGALYELQDWYRGRYRAKERLFDAHAPPDHQVDPFRPADRLDLDRALDSLSPRAREIIELREHGFKYEEIAGMIGSTEAAIKMQVKRAFDRLRDIMQVVVLLLLRTS
jgi:RNA polymerase sigma-70 factor (ECF subfamily)